MLGGVDEFPGNNSSLAPLRIPTQEAIDRQAVRLVQEGRLHRDENGFRLPDHDMPSNT